MTATPARQDTEWKHLFGICAALAADFGFNALWLRIAFGVGVVFAPLMSLAIYAVLGVIVLSSRLIFPDRKPVPASVAA